MPTPLPNYTILDALAVAPRTWTRPPLPGTVVEQLFDRTLEDLRVLTELGFVELSAGDGDPAHATHLDVVAATITNLGRQALAHHRRAKVR